MAGLFGNLWLARRLEKAEADNARRLPAILEIGGGVAAFAGAASPLTHALGLGMSGAISNDELDQVERFYREQESPVVIEACPLADPSLFDLLGLRAYRITEFNNVLVRTIDPPPLEVNAEVRRTQALEEILWSRTVAEGFFERDHFTDEEIRMGALLFQSPNTIPWLAFVDEKPAAAAAMVVRDSLASLFADSTRPAFRRLGLQTNLIRARIQHAAELQCDLITASTVPGTTSQLNYEKLGFRIVYTKMIFTRP